MSEGFTASTDLPVSLYYETLIEKYHDAKFILTTKSSDDEWYQSWEQLVRNTSLIPRFVPWLKNAKKFDRYNRWLLSLFHKDDAFLTTAHLIPQNAEKVKQAYNSHNARVRETIPAKQLLEFHPKEGWEPLCEFLNKPVPGVPFPHSNSSEDVALEMYKFVMVHNGMLLIGVTVVLFLLRTILKRIEQLRRQVQSDKQKQQ